MTRRRRSAGQGDAGADRWLGTYGDMITLLMAFFVMLYAISQVDEKKFRALVSGLDVFGNTAAADGLLYGGEALLEGEQDEPSNASKQVDAKVPDPKTAAVAAKAERQATVDQVEKVERQLDAEMRRAGLPETITDVRADPRGVIISVSSDDVLFALGSSQLSRLGRRVIGAVANVVRRYDDEVVVEGHTDDLPLRRAGYSNWNLSTDRAVAVVERLHRSHRIDQRRLVASGYGEFRPLVPNTGAANRARNRRVDVLLRLDEE